MSARSFILVILALVCPVIAKTVVKSPDGKIEVNLELRNGMPHWSAGSDGIEFLKPSPIAIRLGKKPETVLGVDGGTVEVKLHDSKWKPAWGQFSEVRNYYREAVWH